MKLLIDYATHPAFQNLMKNGPRRLRAAEQYFAGLDHIWDTVLGREFSGRSEDIPLHFITERGALMSNLMAQLHGYIDDEFLPVVAEGLDKSADAILAEIKYIILARSISRKYSKRAEAMAERLREESMVGLRLEPWRRMELVSILRPYMDQAKEQRRINGGARCFINIPGWGRDWNLITSFLRLHHVEEGISAFAGYPLGLVGYALTYSHPDETWFAQVYSDIGLSAAKCVQMHYDLDNLSAKSMLYLNEVGDEDGPFSYCSNSRAMIASRSQTSFFKYFDYAGVDFAQAKKAMVGHRPIMSVPNMRKYFSQLPAAFQGTATPGDDVVSGSQLENELLESESIVTSDVGDLAVFAGGETLHRGGIVKSGERWALQMIYKAPYTFRQRVRAKVGNFVRRVIGKPRARTK